MSFGGSTFIFTFLPVSGAVALILTAALAYFLGRRFTDRRPAILIAGLALPVLIAVLGLYNAVSKGADGPPPGIILLASIAVAAITAPVSLTVSGLAVRFARG